MDEKQWMWGVCFVSKRLDETLAEYFVESIGMGTWSKGQIRRGGNTFRIGITEDAFASRCQLNWESKMTGQVRGRMPDCLNKREISSLLLCAVSNIRQCIGPELGIKRKDKLKLKSQEYWSPPINPSTLAKKGWRFSCVERATLPQNGQAATTTRDRRTVADDEPYSKNVALVVEERSHYLSRRWTIVWSTSSGNTIRKLTAGRTW